MPSIAAVILVGGQARRLGEIDKSRLLFGSKTCLECTRAVLSDQVEKIALSVGQRDRYNHAKQHDVLFDWPSKKNEQGAAFAILGSLDWAKKERYSAIISTPVDTPLLPGNFASRLIDENNGNTPSVYKTSEGLQGLHALWPVSCFDDFKNAVLGEGILKISALHAALKSVEVMISDEDSFKFANLNSESDLKKAEKYLTDQ